MDLIFADYITKELFSLLRSEARDEAVSQLPPATLKVKSSEEGLIPLPIEDPVDGEGNPKLRDCQERQEQPTRAKTRLLMYP